MAVTQLAKRANISLTLANTWTGPYIKNQDAT